MLWSEEQGSGPESVCARYLHLKCYERFGNIQDFVNTHVEFCFLDDSFQFLIYLVSLKAYTDVSLNAFFCKVEDWPHLQIAL